MKVTEFLDEVAELLNAHNGCDADEYCSVRDDLQDLVDRYKRVKQDGQDET